MEPSEESITVRIKRINSLILQNVGNSKDIIPSLSREGLLDTLQVLYDECNNDCLKNTDKNIKKFVDSNKKILQDLKKLRVNLSDFEVKNVIGRGHFGEVHVVKEKQTGDIYAMKTIKKYKALEEKNASFEEERNIMAFSTSPWLTMLQYAFQDGVNLYFVMEYHPGGDLVGLLYRQGGTLPETAARFYIAELVLALHDLHDMGYVHRDIKPDNILLDRCGHIKIVDFGSAAKLNAHGEMSNVIPVGAPDYIAPEILQSFENKANRPYGISCDYWSLGVLAYEMTVGNTPFSGQNTTTTYSKIINHSSNLKFPSDIVLSQGYVSLIRGLLTDESRRLTYEGILKHAVYRNVDFNSLRDQVPPYVPKISSIDDTSNFIDVEHKRSEPHIDSFKRKTQFSGKNLPFIGFTFTHTIHEDFRFSSSTVVKDETVVSLKKEVEKLQKELLSQNDSVLEKDSSDRKLEEKNRKLESIESVRNNLEKDLAKRIAECSSLKRTLELERRDRADLEKKALDLIKSSKLKWEAAEKLKIENMEAAIDEQRQIVFSLQKENQNLKDQLNQISRIEDKHKVSLDKVERLRRSSVMGLENRLQKLTTQSENELTEMQTRLGNEIQRNGELQTIITNVKSELQNVSEKFEHLQVKYEEAEKNCLQQNTLTAKLEKYKADCEKYATKIRTLEDQIADLNMMTHDKNSLEGKLKFQQELTESFRKEIQNLKTELNFEKISHKNSVEELTAQYKEQLRGLETQLTNAKSKNTEYESKITEVENCRENYKQKVTSLEILVKQLESGVNQLEDSSDKQDFLQKQVERLETQLAEAHEHFALEKQELAQLKTKYWRMERELQNANLDKKIIERDYKEAKEQNNQLTVDIDTLTNRINDSKKVHESAILELSGLNENLNCEVVKLSQLIRNLEEKLQSEREKSDDEKVVIDDLRNVINKKDSELAQVRMAMNNLKENMARYESQVLETKKNNENLSAQFERLANERNVMLKEMQDLKRKRHNSEENQNVLRDSCMQLETQLEELDNLYKVSEDKRISLQAEIEKLSSELSKEKESTLEARKATNEEKSQRLLAETKLRKQTEEVESLQKEIDSYQTQCKDFKAYSSGLANDLTRAEQTITDLEIELKECRRQVEDCMAENFALKEENSSQLTYLNNLKESNYKLSQSLSQYKDVNKAVINQINSLESILSEKEMLYKEREIKTEATIRQQTKLIDYLQSKIEEGKKKKTLSDKLFGSSKKENQPPLSIVLNYREIDQQLQKERELTKNLQQEISKLRSSGKSDKVASLKDQRKILEQIVQSPQKNDVYRSNSVHRMQHNIPHRFESKLCTKSVTCGQCGDQLTIGRSSSICSECLIMVHTACARSVPRTCGLPQAFAKHYSDSLSKLQKEDVEEVKKDFDYKIDIEGWVKIPVKLCWEKHYACLTSQALTIYSEPPNNSSAEVIERLEFDVPDTYGKVTLEPLESEIGIPVASSDLPFVIKVEICPNTTCWPPKYIVFMTLSVEDKDKWYKALDNSLNHSSGKYAGHNILTVKDDLEVNCLVELNKELMLLGTNNGLQSFNVVNGSLSHISGPLHVHQISFVPKLNVALMIVDDNRVLISCDYKHLENLAQCAQCSMPTLQFDVINVKNISGFHMFETSHGKKDMLCAATARQIIIMFYDLKVREFIPEKILDTAQPTSCILFTEHSLIIGADKFFEIDLSNYEAEEFLDTSDRNLSPAITCYNMKSFPMAILQVSKSPIEYLLCFHEFAVFVDECGRSTRSKNIEWTLLPNAFYFTRNYLYIVQFASLEMMKIPKASLDSGEYESHRVSLVNPKYLGSACKGIYVISTKDIKFISSTEVSDSISIDTESLATTENNDDSDGDNFSFTSSMVRSLDGHLSDEGEVHEKRVKFARTTDL